MVSFFCTIEYILFFFSFYHFYVKIKLAANVKRSDSEAESLVFCCFLVSLLDKGYLGLLEGKAVPLSSCEKSLWSHIFSLDTSELLVVMLSDNVFNNVAHQRDLKATVC